MTAATCAACQVTLPAVRSAVERADELATAVELFNANADAPVRDVRRLHAAILEACLAYRTGPPPVLVDDQGRPLCSPCFWKAVSA